MVVKKIGKNKKQISELRQDLVSGEWVAVAVARAKRPHFWRGQKKKIFRQSRGACPFENLEKSGHKKPISVYDRKGNRLPVERAKTALGAPKVGDWFLQLIPNKYPAFSAKGVCMFERKEGPFVKMDGVGFHEVFVYRDHSRYFNDFSVPELALVLRAFQDRYNALKEDDCVEYISIFHNHGSEAGASVSHPHSQLIGVPVIPPDVSRSIIGSKNFFNEHQKCVHCTMLEWERMHKERIIFENELFIAFCPYVSRTAFEVRIFPKIHQPRFEMITEEDRISAAGVLSVVLKKLTAALNDPPYNFFIHTAPCKAVGADHYHWHIEILPKTAIWAGFELGTGIEICSVKPEDAAKHLRSIK